jgi:ribonuclease-3
MKFENISAYLLNEFIPMNIGLDLSKLMSEFTQNVTIPGLPFANDTLFFQAFSHKSFVHENKKIVNTNNERLEFLGDSVLSLYVTTRIFREFPHMSEGNLSKLRSSIVNEKSLSILAKELDLGKFIMLGKGELKEKGYIKDSILSDTFEAVLGAIYTLKGIDIVTIFLDELFEKTLVDFFKEEVLETFDAKSKLQERIMAKYKINPTYQIEDIENDQFRIELQIDKKTIKTINSNSKKKGMQQLAQIVLSENLI